MTKNINYLKINDERINLTDDGISYNDGLSLTFYNNDYDENHLISIFSSFQDNIIIIYSCIVQDDGTETDEFISCRENVYIIYNSINYDSENDTFTITLIS